MNLDALEACLMAAGHKHSILLAVVTNVAQFLLIKLFFLLRLIST